MEVSSEDEGAGHSVKLPELSEVFGKATVPPIDQVRLEVGHCLQL